MKLFPATTARRVRGTLQGNSHDDGVASFNEKYFLVTSTGTIFKNLDNCCPFLLNDTRHTYHLLRPSPKLVSRLYQSGDAVVSVNLSSIYSDTRRFNLPSLFTNEAFSIQSTITNGPGETYSYTGQNVLLTIDPQSGSRVMIPNGDSGITVSVDGLTLTINKPASWTLTNLTPGQWTYTLLIGSDTNRDVHAWGSFAVVMPPGGNL